MKIIDLSCDYAPQAIVATLGFFDGVHRGHRHLLAQVKHNAAQLGLSSAVITFPVHPREVLESDYQPPLLCGFDEKLTQLATTDIDMCIVLPFTKALSELSAHNFIHSVLKKQIGVHTMFVGHDHRFGHNREEGFQDYAMYGTQAGIDFVQATEFRANGMDVSSSKIRKLLSNGNVTVANRLLSYNYTISGKIIEGYQVGRTIGFPTANIQSWERYKVIPALGVYAVHVHIGKTTKDGMLYIGTRPTLSGEQKISVEVNIFDFEGDLYNQSLTVEFIDFIRPDQIFQNLDLLVKQIRKDRDAVINRLKEEKNEKSKTK